MKDRIDQNNPGVVIREERCTGCMHCQLICSFTYFGAFNPRGAMIRINGADEKRIRFTEECNQCGLCTKYCVFGTIVPKGGSQ
jgi:Fe-S-cluster-containing hydrogenase component 2